MKICVRGLNQVVELETRNLKRVQDNGMNNSDRYATTSSPIAIVNSLDIGRGHPSEDKVEWSVRNLRLMPHRGRISIVVFCAQIQIHLSSMEFPFARTISEKCQTTKMDDNQRFRRTPKLTLIQLRMTVL